MMEEHEVVIVGGGIAGLATALALQRTGVKSLVLERADALRAAGAALSLFPNAWRALDVLGVARKLDTIYRPIEMGRVKNIETGAVQDVTFTGTPGSDGMGVRALHRKVLLEALAEELSPDTIRFSSKLAAVKTTVVSEDSSTATLLELEDGTVIRAKVLIGCDGIHSVVAKWLGQTAPIDSGRAAIRGLSVFPQGHGFKHGVQQFVGHGTRAGFAPLSDTDVYWFSTHNTASEKEFARGDPEAICREVTQNLAKDFPSEYLQVVRSADLSTVSWAPLMYRAPWDLFIRRTHQGAITVAGDAFHPMTPDLGQGGGMALEDAVVLARNIAPFLSAGGGASERRVEKGIEAYVKERRGRVAGFIVGAYLSGWVQLGGRAGGVVGWAVEWFRDHIFYRFIHPKIVDAARYDCGTLPTVV